MKEIIVLGAMLGVAALGERAVAQTPKSPDATVAQVQEETKASPDELITLLESKGILTQSEAALVSQKQLLPETKEVLAEFLLSKDLISREEYDRTLQSCSSSAAPAKTVSQHAASSIPGPNGHGEAGGWKSLSDRIASILPGGGQTTDIDFGVIQPSPLRPSADQAANARAKAKSKSDKHHKQEASQTTSSPR